MLRLKKGGVAAVLALFILGTALQVAGLREVCYAGFRFRYRVFRTFMLNRSLRRALWSTSLLVLATSLAFGQATSAPTSPEIEARFQSQIAALMREKDSRTPAMRKMSMELVWAVRTARGYDVRAGLPKFEVENPVRKDGTVDVEFSAPVTGSLVAQLRLLGAQIAGVYPIDGSVSARIPVRSLESAAMLPGVRYVTTPSPYVTNVGSVQSQGDKSMRSDELRSTYGLTGSGVAIGTISDSDRYRETSQSTGDLPASVTVLSNRSGRPGSGEGTAMMELVYDVAPGSDLWFSTGNGGVNAFAQNYRDLFSGGCSVLSDDLIYIAEPAFQDGPVARAINDIWAAGGICFTAAGNENNVRSNNSGVWEGDYANSGVSFTHNGRTGNFHAWTGTQTSNQVTGLGTPYLTLQWNDTWGGASSDYDLIVRDSAGNVVLASTSNNVGGFPYEGVNNTVANRFAYVTKISGNNRVLRLNQFRGTFQVRTGGQIYGHAAGDKGIGVAAINAIRSIPRAFNAGDVTTGYSSDGLRRVYYDADNNQISTDLTYAGAVIRNKPVVAGPDGTSTTVPGFQPFYGTSAAAPHVAALSALLKQFAPDATNTQILAALTGGAVDILTPGYDKDSGFGAVSGRGAVKVLMEAKTLGVSPASGNASPSLPASFTLNLGRNAPPNGLTINVSATGDTSRFNLPTSFTVAAGSATGSFAVSSNNTGTGSATLTLTEAYSGAQLGTATVAAVEDGPAISTLVLDRTEAVGGARNAVATVTLTSPADSAYFFEIQSSNPAVASVPASTAVSTGATTRNFTVTTYPVATDTPVTIRVRKQGTTDPWTEASLTVKAPKPNSCVPSPTSGTAGTSITYTVKLDGPAPASGLTVGLTTTDADIIAVPRNLTFASGESQKSFTVAAGASQVKKVVTVSVRYQLQTMAQGKFTYLVPEVSSLALTPNPVVGGNSVTGTVTLASPAGAGGVLVPIAHYGTGISHPASIVIPAGSTTGTFTVTTSAVTAKRTNKVYVKTGNVTKTVTLTINP